jgi:hypothetical protein
MYNDVIILQLNCPHVSSMLSICLVPAASVAWWQSFPPIIRNLGINLLNVKFVSLAENVFSAMFERKSRVVGMCGLATIYTDFLLSSQKIL